MLYSGGFFSDHDKKIMARVHECSPDQLAETSFPFEDSRLPEMLLRYRARNFPHSLAAAEQAQWDEFRYQRLTEPDGGASICMEEFHALIEQLLASGQLTSAQRELLRQLLDYGDSLLC